MVWEASDRTCGKRLKALMPTFVEAMERHGHLKLGLLNGKAGISPAMALALERIGWSNASFWMRLQAAYELAQERRRQAA